MEEKFTEFLRSLSVKEVIALSEFIITMPEVVHVWLDVSKGFSKAHWQKNMLRDDMANGIMRIVLQSENKVLSAKHTKRLASLVAREMAKSEG